MAVYLGMTATNSDKETTMFTLTDRVSVKQAATVCGVSNLEMNSILQQAKAAGLIELDEHGHPTWGDMLALIGDYKRDPAVEAAEVERYATRMRAAARAGNL